MHIHTSFVIAYTRANRHTFGGRHLRFVAHGVLLFVGYGGAASTPYPVFVFVVGSQERLSREQARCSPQLIDDIALDIRHFCPPFLDGLGR